MKNEKCPQGHFSSILGNLWERFSRVVSGFHPYLETSGRGFQE